MEVLKKIILQAVITGTTFTGGTVIIPDLKAMYYVKIGLKQTGQDFGFFDSYIEPINPDPVIETRYLIDNDSSIFTDNEGNRFIY